MSDCTQWYIYSSIKKRSNLICTVQFCTSYTRVMARARKHWEAEISFSSAYFVFLKCSRRTKLCSQDIIETYREVFRTGPVGAQITNSSCNGSGFRNCNSGAWLHNCSSGVSNLQKWGRVTKLQKWGRVSKYESAAVEPVYKSEAVGSGIKTSAVRLNRHTD